MFPCTSLRSAFLAYLLNATLVSAVTIKIPIPVIIVGSTVHTVAFSFLIFFAILTGLLFVIGLARVLGSKEELPPDVLPSKYETGLLFHWLSFFAVTLWWAWLILFIVYMRDALMRKTGFSDSGYIALYVLDQLADVFVAASALQLVHYRRAIYNPTIPPSTPLKKAFDVILLIVQIGIIGYTNAFLSMSIANVTSDHRYTSWLISWYVYTLAYGLVVVNVVGTMLLFKKTLRKNSIVDEVRYSRLFGVGYLAYLPPPSHPLMPRRYPVRSLFTSSSKLS